MANELKIHEVVNWDKNGGGKLELKAEDYDFKLVHQQLSVDSDNKKSFVNQQEVKLKSDEMYEVLSFLCRGCLDAHNRIKFKLREMKEDTVFFQGRVVTRGLVGLYLRASYHIQENGMKNRKVVLGAVKLDNWKEDRAGFMKDPDSYRQKYMFMYSFNTFSVGRGGFDSKDMNALADILQYARDCHYKKNLSYNTFLVNMKNESNGPDANNGAGYGKPSNVPTTDSPAPVDDEFPF